MQVFLGDERGGMKVELLEPWDVEQNDFLERFLTRHGDGVRTTSPSRSTTSPATIERVRAAGYEPVGIDLSDPQWREAFLLPKEAHGTVVQLAESNAPYASPLAEYRVRSVEHGVEGEPRWWPEPPPRASTCRPTCGASCCGRRRSPPTPEFFTGLLDGTTIEQGDGWVELGLARRRAPPHRGAPRRGTAASTASSSRAPGRRRELDVAGDAALLVGG